MDAAADVALSAIAKLSSPTPVAVRLVQLAGNAETVRQPTRIAIADFNVHDDVTLVGQTPPECPARRARRGCSCLHGSVLSVVSSHLDQRAIVGRLDDPVTVVMDDH